MNPCEDYPACGHGTDAQGNCDCPDSEGRFKCVSCGKKLPKKAPSSICRKCQRRHERLADYGMEPGGDFDYSMNY